MIHGSSFLFGMPYETSQDAEILCVGIIHLGDLYQIIACLNQFSQFIIILNQLHHYIITMSLLQNVKLLNSLESRKS